MGRFNHLIPSGGGTATASRPSGNRFAHLIPRGAPEPDTETPLAKSVGEILRDFALKGPMSERFQQEIAPVTPPIIPFNVATNVAVQAQKTGANIPALLRAGARGLPFTKFLAQVRAGKPISDLTSVTEPEELTPPRELITNVVRAVNPAYEEPENPFAKLGLDLAGGTLTASPLAGQAALSRASRAVDLLRATRALKNAPTRVARLREAEFGGKVGPVAEAAAMPKQLGYQSFQQATPEENIRSQFQRLLRGKEVPAPEPAAQEAARTTDLVRFFRGLGRGGQLRVGKNLSEEELNQAIRALRRGRRLTEAPMPQAKPAPVQTKNVQAPPTLDPTVEKLIQILKEAKPVRGAQEELYSMERGRRFAKAAGISESTKGRSGFHAELAALKGELPKQKFEPVAGKLLEDEMTSLFEQLKHSKKLEYLETVTARKALEKVVEGAVPTEGEISLLKREFGSGFAKVLESKMPLLDKLKLIVMKTANTPRAVMSSFDLSAIRQGAFLVRRQKQFRQAAGAMIDALKSEKNLDAIITDIKQRPTYPMMRNARLAITELDAPMLKQEEAFMRNYAEQIPGLRRGVRASNRAYVGFLNKLRADVFDDIVTNIQRFHPKFTPDSPVIKAVADYVNTATGRGTVAALKNSIGFLNSSLWSPRLLASRLKLSNPVYFMRMPKGLRKEALKDLVGFHAVRASILALASAAGAKVVTDPTHTDWGKIVIGKTRYDTSFGFAQLERLYARLILGYRTSSKGRRTVFGKGYKAPTRLEEIGQFITYKESPAVSFITDYLRGKTAIGEKLDLPVDILKRLVPMVAQDFNELVNEWGPAGFVMGIPSVFGVSSQTY